MLSPLRRKLAALPIVLAALSPSLASANGADAAVATCAGRPATHVGTAGGDVIYGTNGNDVIVGLAGNDTIYGFSGDDVICSGNGADAVFAGFGNDRVFGGNGNDRLRGGYGFDRIWGGYGNDWMVGDDGNDWMWGGNGNDDMYGGRGNDHLYGNIGRDWMAGQYGYDRVSGGWGQDLALGENPRPDPDNNADNNKIASVFANVARFCNTGCIAGSSQFRPLQPVAAANGVIYNQVAYSFDSEGFALEVRLRDTRNSAAYQVTEIAAAGFLDGYGQPRTYRWHVSRGSSDPSYNGPNSIDATTSYLNWIINRTS